MNRDLEKVKLAVLGGDDREIVLIEYLAAKGAEIKAAGYDGFGVLRDIIKVNSIAEALEDAQGVLLPMVGTDEKGVIRALYHQGQLKLEKSHLKNLPSGLPVIVGIARNFLRQWCQELKLNLLEIADMDQLAILNAIPSAEGAIQIAMEESLITIHNSKSLVIGFGRVGQTIAHLLYGLGAEVKVVARKASDCARAFTLGYQGIAYHQFPEAAADADFMFNTVPAMVIDAKILLHTAPNCLIIDLATQPGGTDFQTAARLGIRAILAPGLPGKVAPVTAGKILTKVVPDLLRENLKL